MELRACLNATTWAMLLAIARTHGLRVPSATTKAALVDLLAARLPVLVNDDAFLAGLDPDIRPALHALATALQPVARHDFDRAYGPIRAATRTREGDPRLLSRHPVSTAERVLYAGLAYLVPEAPTGRPCVVVPAQWRAPFAALAPLAPPAPPAAAPVPLDLSLALALYLAALQSAPPRLVHGRWLPPRYVHFLASLLHIPAPERPRERVIPYLAFLRYAADTLGLVTVIGEHLLPSLAAPAWLARPLPDRAADLWRQCLRDPQSPDHWTAFHLPGHRLRHPIAFLHRLLDRLASVTLADAAPTAPGDAHPLAWRPLENLAPATRLDDLLPFWELEDHPDLGRDLAWRLLSGPLTWLGVVHVAETPEPAWRLTPLGVWLLGRGEPPPTVPHASLRLLDDGSLHPPATPDLPVLLALAQWAALVPTPALEGPAAGAAIPSGAQTPLPHFQLTPASVIRPIAQGARLEDLFTLLSRHASPPPTPDLQQRLATWASARAPYTLRPAWLLTAPTDAHLDSLLRRRSLRGHLRRRLDLTTAEVAPGGLSAIVEALRRLGLSVTLPTPTPPDFAATPEGVAPSPALSPVQAQSTPADALWLLTALHVHTYVARRLGLVAPPAAVADTLAARLDPFAQGQAQFAAEQLAVHLEHALAALDPFSHPLPQERLLERLTQAIQSGATLRMTYWTANRPLPVTRRVQPRRLEWRGDTAYLIAYCYRRLAELTFRLDRIVELAPSDPEPEAESQPTSASPPAPSQS